MLSASLNKTFPSFLPSKVGVLLPGMDRLLRKLLLKFVLLRLVRGQRDLRRWSTPCQMKEGRKEGIFYIHNPIDRIAHTTAFETPVVEHWLEREIAQWVHAMKDRSDDPSHHERTLLPRSYISLPHPFDTLPSTCQRWRTWLLRTWSRCRLPSFFPFVICWNRIAVICEDNVRKIKH